LQSGVLVDKFIGSFVSLLFHKFFTLDVISRKKRPILKFGARVQHPLQISLLLFQGQR